MELGDLSGFGGGATGAGSGILSTIAGLFGGPIGIVGGIGSFLANLFGGGPDAWSPSDEDIERTRNHLWLLIHGGTPSNIPEFDPSFMEAAGLEGMDMGNIFEQIARHYQIGRLEDLYARDTAVNLGAAGIAAGQPQPGEAISDWAGNLMRMQNPPNYPTPTDQTQFYRDMFDYYNNANRENRDWIMDMYREARGGGNPPNESA